MRLVQRVSAFGLDEHDRAAGPSGATGPEGLTPDRLWLRLRVTNDGPAARVLVWQCGNLGAQPQAWPQPSTARRKFFSEARSPC